MKKLLLLISVLLGVTILMANPIPTSSITLSELFFDSNGKWVIELQYSDANQKSMPIDSIWIKSSSGISVLKRFKIVGTTGVIVVRNDSLLTNLTINPKGDSVEILFAFESGKRSKGILIFGNQPGAFVASPRFGQSIAGIPPYFSYNESFYSLDKSPTIGSKNDTIGMCGTIKGHIYDKNNHLLTKTSGWFTNFQTELYFYRQIDGSYSTRLYSKKDYMDNIYYYNLQSQGSWAQITPIEISMQPDSVVSIDIHLLDSLNVSNEKIYTNSELLFKLFPNPTTDLSVNYEINIPVKSSNCYLEMINVNGQKIARFVITENKGRITLPTTIKSGTYSILLMVNNKNYGSSKVIINR